MFHDISINNLILFRVFLSKQMRAVYKNLLALVPSNKQAFLGQFYGQVVYFFFWIFKMSRFLISQNLRLAHNIYLSNFSKLFNA